VIDIVLVRLANRLVVEEKVGDNDTNPVVESDIFGVFVIDKAELCETDTLSEEEIHAVLIGVGEKVFMFDCTGVEETISLLLIIEVIVPVDDVEMLCVKLDKPDAEDDTVDQPVVEVITLGLTDMQLLPLLLNVELTDKLGLDNAEGLDV